MKRLLAELNRANSFLSNSWFRWLGLAFTGCLLAACINKPIVTAIVSPNHATESSTVFLDAPVLAEASGMAISRSDKELLWMHNDSGAEPLLWAVTTSGHVRGKLNIIGAEAIDWEDMASFVWLDQPYLLIADTGDNNHNRDHVTLYIIAEPDLATADQFEFNTPVVRQIELSFSDGAVDIEAVAVDMVLQSIILITKQNYPAKIYQIPLHSIAEHDLKPVGEINRLPVLQSVSKKRGRITALDIFSNVQSGKQSVLLLTGAYAYVYERQFRQSWAETFLSEPLAVLDVGDLRKPESAGFSWQSSQFYIGSEKSPYPLLQVQLLQ